MEIRNDVTNVPHGLPVPVGDSDFRDVINNESVYVDKTLFIDEILATKDKVVLITRPRRFGKTLNMTMLKYFLDLQVDGDGRKVADNTNRKLFDNLHIASTPTINEQGQYPVIFLSLKDVKGPNYQLVEQKLRLAMSRIFEEYQYLIATMDVEDSKAQKFLRIKNEKAEYGDLTDSLLFLSELIAKHHKVLPYVLIDEYDVPLNNSYNTNHYNDVLELIRALFSAGLKDNTQIKKAVVTGVFKIAKSGIWTGMNNTSDHSIISKKYAQYFGFTEEEVESLLKLASITDPSTKLEVKQWYNGYRIGDYTIYNPWSIIKYFSELTLAPYWVNTESMVAGDRKLSTNIMINDVIHAKVNLLIANFDKELTEITVNPEVIFSTKQEQKAEREQEPEEESSLFGLLLFGGYLSVDNAVYDESGFLVCQSRIPNREVLSIYNNSISLWIKDQLSISKTSFSSLCKEFILEDTASVKYTVDKALEIFGDRIAEKNESVFHGLIQSICLLKGDKHRLASESYTGQGRADSIFYPIKGKSDTVIIHEYKIIKDLKDELQLKTALKSAIWQIYEKIYVHAPLAKNKYFAEECQNIELRAVVILCNQITNEIVCEIMVRNHNLEEMKEIVSAFQSRPKDKVKIAELRIKIEEEVKKYIEVYM
jgi:hypothetical protein